jgi:hypothetical protein
LPLKFAEYKTDGYPIIEALRHGVCSDRAARGYLQFLMPNYRTINMVATSKNMRMIRALRDAYELNVGGYREISSFQVGSRALRLAASIGDIKFLEYARDNGIILDTYLIRRDALSHGQLKVIQWLKQFALDSIRFTEETMTNTELAIMSGSLATFEEFYRSDSCDHGCFDYDTYMTFADECTPDMAKCATSDPGHLNSIHVLAHGSPDLQMLNEYWLDERNIDDREVEFLNITEFVAVGRLDILKWIHKTTPRITDGYRPSLHFKGCKNIEAFKFAIEVLNAELPEVSATQAATTYSPEIFDYIFGHTTPESYEDSSKLYAGAVAGRNEPMLKYLINKHYPLCEDEVRAIITKTGFDPKCDAAWFISALAHM